MRTVLLSLCLVLTASLGVANADTKTDSKAKPAPKEKMAPKEKSLFDRLGGLDAIKAVVHEFTTNVGADKRINKRFAKSDIPKLEKTLVDQVCEATGGPCKYAGKNMVEAHKGMKISEAEFTALVEDLVKALDKFKVPAKEKNELLGALGGMKGDIVGK